MQAQKTPYVGQEPSLLLLAAGENFWLAAMIHWNTERVFFLDEVIFREKYCLHLPRE